MKITAYSDQHNLDMAGGGKVANYNYGYTALGSNLPLIESGSGAVGSGPQAAAWDHVHPALAAGAASFGSNSTRVSGISGPGSSSSNSRSDHLHDGIGTITASSSNTMDRGTFNLRPGTNVSFGLTDSDGNGGFDTLTINASAAGGGGSSTITTKDEGSTLSSTVTTLDFVGAGVTASGSGATTTITISGSTASYPGSVEGLYQWFKADAISGLSNGGSVVEWRNSAPLTPGMDLITHSGTPTYQTNVVNSLPVVRFGGSAHMRFLSPPLAGSSFCFVIVFKLSSIANTYSGVLGNGGGTDKGGFFIKSNGKSAYYPASGSTAYDGTGAITYGTTNWNYSVINCVGLTYDTRRNASADKSGTSFTWTYGATESVFYLANQAVASRVMSGDIAEVLIYGRALTSTEITSVESYITGKYAI